MPIFLLFSLLLPVDISYAIDWPTLHEEAQTVSLESVLREVDKNSRSEGLRYLLGLVYIKQYKTEKVREVFQELWQEDPDFYPALWGLSEYYRLNHDYEKAVSLLEKVIKDHPDFAPAFLSLAFIRYRQMSFNQTIKLTAKVIDMDPDKINLATRVQAHGLYAAAKGMSAHYGGPLKKSMNFFAVQKHLNIAKQLQPDSATVNFGWGSYYMNIPAILGRDIDKAGEYILRAIQQDPYFPDPYARMAQIYRYRGDEQKYRDLLEQALAIDPKNELALDIKNRTCQYICLDDSE